MVARQKPRVNMTFENVWIGTEGRAVSLTNQDALLERQVNAGQAHAKDVE